MWNSLLWFCIVLLLSSLVGRANSALNHAFDRVGWGTEDEFVEPRGQWPEKVWESLPYSESDRTFTSSSSWKSWTADAGNWICQACAVPLSYRSSPGDIDRSPVAVSKMIQGTGIQVGASGNRCSEWVFSTEVTCFRLYLPVVADWRLAEAFPHKADPWALSKSPVHWATSNLAAWSQRLSPCQTYIHPGWTNAAWFEQPWS